MDAVFVEFPHSRRRQAASLAAHYVACVLDRQSVEGGLLELSTLANYGIGDRVKTLKGSVRGVIVNLLPDGRVAWRIDGSQTDLIALPESLLIEK